MSEKEAQLDRITSDRQRITKLLQEAQGTQGADLAISLLEMSLSSLDMQEAIWRGAHG